MAITPKPVKTKFEWQPIGAGGEFGPNQTFRAAVIGGWLICTENVNSGKDVDPTRETTMTFVEDQQHVWIVI